MSSAAKLRRFGKGTAAVAVAATAMTAFGPIALAWDTPNPDQVIGVAETRIGEAATTWGTIGLVDTQPVGATDYLADNQGATLVYAGQKAQSIGDVRLTLPNTFKSGDYVDLLLLDRSASQNDDGFTNGSDATSVGFSSAPTVKISDPQNYDTAVTADTDSTTAAAQGSGTVNTETSPANPWMAENASPDPLADINDVKPSVVPDIKADIVADSHNRGKNVIRLAVNNASKGDPSAKWVVTLSNLKVDLGVDVTPGDLRLIPFAKNAVGSATPYSLWFKTAGTGGDEGVGEGNYVRPADNVREIDIYTVPAMVSPVTVKSGVDTIMADGTPQSVGSISVTETQGYSMGDGNYQFDVTGARIQNANLDNVKVTVTGGGTTEAVSGLTFVGANGNAYTTQAAATTAGTTITSVRFTLANMDATKKSTVSLEGLLLTAATPGRVAFNLSGGTISDDPSTAGNQVAVWLARYAGSGTLPAGAPAQIGSATGIAQLGVPAGAADSDTDGAVNQIDILPPLEELYATSAASAGTAAIGGNNRYETARKIAKEWSPLGDDAIIASGENYPDALSSGFLSQRLGAPIILTMQGSVPADTMESLRERGVRKVYLIGGEAAISKAVSDKLLATPSYMWSDSSKNLVPRGGNLEVVRLGGSSRYSTNALVNMYAAAQNTGVAVVGQTQPEYGKANKTTAMIARGDNFADALTANVLTAGRATGDLVRSGLAGTTSYALGSTTGGATVVTADLAKLGTGTYVVADPGGGAPFTLSRNGTVIATQAAAGSTTFNLTGGTGVVTFTAAPADADGFTIVSTTTGATGEWVPRLENLYALPVILTPKGELGDQAKSELSTLHVEHALIIGGSDVIPDAVVKSVDGMNITTRRLAGTDRYDTARVVNEYAWTASVGSTTNLTPGLGFKGGVGQVGGVNVGMGEVFLANGTRFPDALVAGPWVSRRNDAMVLVLQSSIPEATKKYLTDNAANLDRAIGLGLGAAVSSTVIMEANRLVSSK